MHTSHLNHLDIGPRLAGYCTLVAFSGLWNSIRMEECSMWYLNYLNLLWKKHRIYGEEYIIIIGSISLYLTYFMSVATGLSTAYRTWRISARVVLHIF